MQCLDELKSLKELCSQATAKVCADHRLPLDLACINCEQAKCSSCRVKCFETNHVVHNVGDESFDSYVRNLVARITAMEMDLQQKSEVLEKPRRALGDAKEARDRHLNALKQRKRRIVDAVERAFEMMELSLANAYDDLQTEGNDVAAAADGIACDLSDARNYVRQLLESNDKCEIFKQQKIIRERLSVLSDILDCLNERLATSIGEVKIESSLPVDMEEVVGAWIGKLYVYSASSSIRHQQPQQQQQCFSFGTASASVHLPVDCWDVALTTYGRLLLAAGELGLIEHSSASGRQLSRCWRPPMHSSGSADQVLAVAALSDGRAAVSLIRCVVLLRRGKGRQREKDGGTAVVSSWWQQLVVAAGDDAWTEDVRVHLPWTPKCLAAHGDVLVASQYHGHRLHLLRLSCRPLLSTELRRTYDIGSLAVTARAVVTGSYRKVKLGIVRRWAYVLDAHSLADDHNDKRLWRHVLSRSDVKEEETLQGICADSSGGCLYAAMHRSDQSRGCVCALSLADGSELRRFALSFDPAAAAPAQPLLLPKRLSLSDAATLCSPSGRVLLLAAMCWDSQTREWRTVMVHRSSGVELA